MRARCHKRNLLFLGLLALISIAAGAPSETATVLQQQGPATLSALAKVEGGQVNLRLADSLRLLLTVDGSDNLEVKPTAIQASEVIKTRGRLTPVIAANGKNRLRWQQHFHLDLLVPGNHAIQFEPFAYREKPGEWKTVNWRPILVKVTTQMKSPDADELRDITDIEKLPERPSPWMWLAWSLAGVGGAVLLFLGLRKWRRHSRFAPGLTPQQWARRELERVLALNLPANGEVERFHTMLSNVVRRYLEKRFALPARRQTTPEFLETMQNAPQLSADQRALVRSFLERCDVPKFANAQVSGEECAATAAMVAKFLE
jgi:hypothetical protein